MSTKTKLLALLEKERGQFFSGEQIAAQLQVSRNAVWKAVNALRADGFSIDAVQNRGYALTIDSNVLSAPAIAQYLGEHAAYFTILTKKAVASTNQTVREMAQAGAEEGTVLLVESQTAGRGRMQRTFFSPDGTGIYMSLLLRPAFTAEQSLHITTAAAVAVAETVEQFTGETAKIKWVNDVYVKDRKVCGILTEAALGMEQGMLEYAVLGIGLNVFPPASGMPAEISDTAAPIFTETPYPADVRNRLAAGILKRFWTLYQTLPADTAFLQAYRSRSWLDGKEIVVLQGNTQKKARAIGIDDACHLLVMYPDQTTAALSSGEVSTRVSESS